MDGPKENGQILVTRGTVLGTIHSGTGTRTVLRWIRGRLLNLLHISRAVSLSSSCEEFSEPKSMTKGTHTRTSQPGSPMNFAHVNKFSFLAPDDNEFTGEVCTSLHTSMSQCQQRKCGEERVDECRRDDERVDECTTVSETKFPSHRGSGTSKLNARQVSYLAASGGDSRGVYHVSVNGWRRLSAIMDSGSAECVAPESIAKCVPLMETEASRQGQTCHTADGGAIKKKGE